MSKARTFTKLSAIALILTSPADGAEICTYPILKSQYRIYLVDISGLTNVDLQKTFASSKAAIICSEEPFDQTRQNIDREYLNKYCKTRWGSSVRVNDSEIEHEHFARALHPTGKLFLSFYDLNNNRVALELGYIPRETKGRYHRYELTEGETRVDGNELHAKCGSLKPQSWIIRGNSYEQSSYILNANLARRIGVRVERRMFVGTPTSNTAGEKGRF